MNQNQQIAPSQQSNSNKKLIIVVVAIILGFFLIVGGILAATVLVNLNSSRDKAKDTQIKSNIQSLRNSTEIYYETNKTYKGWTADSKISNSIQQLGSSVVTQGLGNKTYVIYAKLPSTQKLYCIDGSGFSGEITNLSVDKTSCQ